MNVAGLLFLLIAHYLCGKGLLKLLKVELKPAATFSFSMIFGVVIISFAPCFLQLMHFPIAMQPLVVAIAVMTALFSIPLLVRFKKPDFHKFTLPALYEWPFILTIAFLVFVSAWRCFYFPPYARDMLAGPELIAEYAVREHNFISSIYHIDLHTSNNFFKSPYVYSLQVIYKILVCPFGQLWLSVLFIPFVIWLYSILKERVHPFLAGALLLFFLAIPELFAYSFVLLYDYSNMVFFFTGFYFLTRYLKSRKQPDFLLSVFLFGFATYIRTETLILLGFIVPLLIFYLYRWKLDFKKIAIHVGLFFAIPFIFYFICINIFVHAFVPLPFQVEANMTTNLLDVMPFFDRIYDIQAKIIFTAWGTALYGYYIYFFYCLLAADLLFNRKRFTEEGKMFLYGFFAVYIGLAFVGYLLPLADLMNTTKRGMFKWMPLILVYMANSGVIQSLSRGLTNWEFPQEKKPAPALRPAKGVNAVPARVQPKVQKKVKGGR